MCKFTLCAYLLQFDDSETYTPRELMRDVGHCRANRVIIFVDQSYGEELVAAAESRSSSLSNVIVLVSTENFNSTSKDKLTHYLLANELHDICLSNLKNVSTYRRDCCSFISVVREGHSEETIMEEGERMKYTFGLDMTEIMRARTARRKHFYTHVYCVTSSHECRLVYRYSADDEAI